MTQDALAEKINLSDKSLSQIELGNNFVSAETLDKLCEALEVTPGVLFGFKDFESKPLNSIEEIIKRLKNNPKLAEIVYKIVIALDY